MNTLEGLHMILSTHIKSSKGFSLLELTFVMIIITVLLTCAVPSMTMAYLEKAGGKTALEIQNIQDAARSYYLQKGSWPSSINTAPGDLESNGFLPSTWSPASPFNNNYATSSTSSLFIISTNVPNGAQNMVASKLPLSNISGNTVSSTIGVPGGTVTPPVHVVTGTIGDGGTIPLPAGYTDAQCQWFVAGSTDETYDSSGHGGCENDQYIETHITTRTVSTYTHGDCRRSYVSNTVNYLGICMS